MRTTAEIEPIALLIDLQILVRRNRIDELDLEGFAMRLEPGLGLIARPDLLGERPVAGDDLAHLLFDGREILRRERLVAEEVVIEAVLDHRPDRHLRAGKQRLHRFGEHMRGIMPDQLQRARILAVDEFDLRILRHRIGEIDQFAVERHGDGLLGERGGNAAGDLGAGRAGLKGARGAIRKGHGNHKAIS